VDKVVLSWSHYEVDDSQIFFEKVDRLLVYFQRLAGFHYNASTSTLSYRNRIRIRKLLQTHTQVIASTNTSYRKYTRMLAQVQTNNRIQIRKLSQIQTNYRKQTQRLSQVQTQVIANTYKILRTHTQAIANTYASYRKHIRKLLQTHTQTIANTYASYCKHIRISQAKRQAQKLLELPCKLAYTFAILLAFAILFTFAILFAFAFVIFLLRWVLSLWLRCEIETWMVWIEFIMCQKVSITDVTKNCLIRTRSKKILNRKANHRHALEITWPHLPNYFNMNINL